MANSFCANVICKEPRLRLGGCGYCHHRNEDVCKVKTKRLKPCPFCGSEVKMLFDIGYVPSGENSGYYVSCPTLGCIGSHTHRRYDTPEELIEAWNNRIICII